ncbi:MAG: hypothetical protein GY942_13200, partial [Aestuariibacter sp.]|nr:hypothetical protein [Aestuariibacter sp.]
NLRENEEISFESYSHLQRFRHFSKKERKKMICEKAERCPAFIRLENGGFKRKDLAHTFLFKHNAARKTGVLNKMGELNPFIFDEKFDEKTKGWYRPNEKEHKTFTLKNGFLLLLIKEMIKNGFSEDLQMRKGLKIKDLGNDEMTSENFGLLKYVDEKMRHPIHLKMGEPLNRGEMLSIVIYTGCSATYDLCKTQNNGDYKKWKFLDKCLNYAISYLSQFERFEFPLFCGLRDVKMERKIIKKGYFSSYLSTSFDKDVAEKFKKGNGVLFEFDKAVKGSIYGKESENYGARCCDVSWISKFGYEGEVLFARGDHFA